MSDREFQGFAQLVYSECGISLNSAKKSMVTTRLTKRLRALEIEKFGEYYDFVMSPKGRKDELTSMIDVITTNTTEFFRERKHFSYLTSEALPRMLGAKRGVDKRLKFWSAGCSTGEEPHTLAMVLSDFFSDNCAAFCIYATDISTRVLAHANRAVYETEAIEPVPVHMKRKYVMCGTGEQSGRCRIVPELRNTITYAKLNLMDDSYNVPALMDVIFCRNVIIYFDQQTKIDIIGKLYDNLVPGGYYFAGHSETLNGINDDFELIAPTVYRKPVR